MHRLTTAQAYAALALLLAASLVASVCVGAFTFTPGEVARYIAQALTGAHGDDPDALRRNVLVSLRLPRVLLAGLTGAVLGVSGALMQGLFRNPIVEPGLTGTSSGAALGAAAVLVLGAGGAATAPALARGAAGLAPLRSALGMAAVPALAAAGAFGATWLVYRLSRAFGRVDVFTLLLAGVAVNAVCGALTGLLSYVARDPQARNVTFWSLGTFTTASWPAVTLVGVVTAVGVPLAWRDAKALNALMLGEDQAALLGVDPALLGAALMELVDVVARVAVAPAELPVGIITAVVGAPLFLVLLLRQRRRGAAGVYA